MNYLLWGVYWGLLIILSNLLGPELKALTGRLGIDPESVGFRWFQRARTFLLFVVSRLITIPGSLGETAFAMKAIVADFAPWRLADGSLLKLGLDGPQLAVVMLATGLLAFISGRQEEGVQIRQWIAQRPIALRWLIYLAAILAVLIFGAYGSGYNAGAFAYMKY